MKPASHCATALPPSEPAAPAAQPRRRFGWLALIAAGIAGGAVATTVVWLAGRFPDNDTSLLEAKLAGLEQHIRDIGAQSVPGGSDTTALDDLRDSFEAEHRLRNPAERSLDVLQELLRLRAGAVRACPWFMSRSSAPRRRAMEEHMISGDIASNRILRQLSEHE